MVTEIHATHAEQTLLFANTEKAAEPARKDKQQRRHAFRNVNAYHKGLRRTPCNGFDPNRYHTVGADEEANRDIGYC